MAARPIANGRRWVYLGAALAVLAALSLWMNLRRGVPRPHGPPPMPAEQVRALSEDRRIEQITCDLRWRVAELELDQMGRWRTLPVPARHVLALSWVERDCPPGIPPRFTGFADLVNSDAPDTPALAEIAEAYEAIGAPRLAAVVRLAADAARAGGFAAIDERFRQAQQQERPVGLLRAYVATHLDDIAGARIAGR